MSQLPTKEVRLDNTSHFPIWNDNIIRCKSPSCNSQTFVTCEKCGTALCFNKDKNCFKSFHLHESTEIFVKINVCNF